MSRLPRIALAAALAIALAGLACGRYGPPRRAEQPAAKAAPAPEAPAPETSPAPEAGEHAAPELEP